VRQRTIIVSDPNIVQIKITQTNDNQIAIGLAYFLEDINVNPSHSLPVQ
jgi:hypothetical protein